MVGLGTNQGVVIMIQGIFKSSSGNIIVMYNGRHCHNTHWVQSGVYIIRM